MIVPGRLFRLGVLLVCVVSVLAAALPSPHTRITRWGPGARQRRSLVTAAASGLQWTVMLKCVLTDDDIVQVKNAVDSSAILYSELTSAELQQVPEAVPCTLTLAQQSTRRTFFILSCTLNHTDVGVRLEALLRNTASPVLPTACYADGIAGIVVARDAVVKVRDLTQDATLQWNLDRIDQRNLPVDHVYDYVNQGTGVTIYLVDTGIHTTHVDFTGRASNIFNAVGDGIDDDDCNGAHRDSLSLSLRTPFMGVFFFPRSRDAHGLDCGRRDVRCREKRDNQRAQGARVRRLGQLFRRRAVSSGSAATVD